MQSIRRNPIVFSVASPVLLFSMRTSGKSSGPTVNPAPHALQRRNSRPNSCRVPLRDRSLCFGRCCTDSPALCLAAACTSFSFGLELWLRTLCCQHLKVTTLCIASISASSSNLALISLLLVTFYNQRKSLLTSTKTVLYSILVINSIGIYNIFKC